MPLNFLELGRLVVLSVIVLLDGVIEWIGFLRVNSPMFSVAGGNS